MAVLRFEIGDNQAVVIENGLNTCTWSKNGWCGPNAKETGLTYDQALWLAEHFEEIDLDTTSVNMFFGSRKIDFTTEENNVHLDFIKTVYTHKLRERGVETMTDNPYLRTHTTKSYDRNNDGSVSVYLDVYDVYSLFGVKSHRIAHAIKKLLMPGRRNGGKSQEQDIEEAITSLKRALEEEK